MQKIWEGGGQTKTNSINQREEGTFPPHSNLERKTNSRLKSIFQIFKVIAVKAMVVVVETVIGNVTVTVISINFD